MTDMMTDVTDTCDGDGMGFSSHPNTQETNNIYTSQLNVEESDSDDDGDETRYDSEQLLNRCYSQMNGSLMQDRRLDVDIPVMNHLGGARMVFANVNVIAKQLDRNLEHLCQRLASELGTEYSINEKHQMVLRGKHRVPKVQSLLLNYIKTFVRCSVCQSLKTHLAKKNAVNYIKCNSCESESPIRKGV